MLSGAFAALAAAHVGGHALERRKHRRELQRRPGRKRWHRRATPDGHRGIPQGRNGTRQRPGGDAGETHGGDQPDEDREHQRVAEVFLLLSHPLVVEQLGHRERAERSRRPRRDDEIPDANRAAGRPFIGRDLELVLQGTSPASVPASSG